MKDKNSKNNQDIEFIDEADNVTQVFKIPAEKETKHFLIYLNIYENKQVPCLKIANNELDIANKAIRLPFKSNEVFVLKQSSLPHWQDFDPKDLDWLKAFLKMPFSSQHFAFNKNQALSNWQYLIFRWNSENFFDRKMDLTYQKGCRENSLLLRNPMFVSMNQPIPNWKL